MTRTLTTALCLVLSIAPSMLVNAGPSEGRMLGFLHAMTDADPENPVLYIRRAHIYAELAHWDEAFADLDKAAKYGEPLSAALIKGEFFSRMGEWEKAREQFDWVISREPDHFRALHGRAEAQAALKQQRAALADYLHVFSLKPDAPSGDYRKAAKLMLALHGADKALQLLDNRMAVTGPIPQLQNMAIDIDAGRGNATGAIKRMSRLSEPERSSPFWHKRMATLQLQAKNREAAKYHLGVAEQLLAGHRRTQVTQALLRDVEALQAQL